MAGAPELNSAHYPAGSPTQTGYGQDVRSTNTQEKQDTHIDHAEALQLYDDEVRHVDLSWKTWMVVFVSCFAIFAQVFVVVAAGSVIAFIIRDLGSPGIGGWIIQGPLLMQAVLSPLVGRLSDVLDRKYLAALPPMVAAIGAIISARATSMAMLVGGGILIGTTLATIAIVQAIPAEVLPLKYRALANGFAFVAGAAGGLVGSVGAGAVTEMGREGWRGIYWMQCALHLATAGGLFLFYHPKQGRDREFQGLRWKGVVWACDPLGSGLFVVSATLMLLALDWAGGAYPWSDPHVVAPLVLGLVLLVAFGVYEWKGRSDGIVAHVFFKGGPNFALSCFAFGVEGWIFYSAVNSVTPQIVLHLGFEEDAFMISVRHLAHTVTTIVCSVPLTYYATRYKDLKWPLLVTFTIFLSVVIAYGRITPSWNHAQIGLNALAGVGQCGPLTLLVACVQFAAPHAYLSTATGLAFSARAIGGAFGSAVLNAIVNGKVSSDLASRVGAAAVGAGLPAGSMPALLAAMGSGVGLMEVPGVDAEILAQAQTASQWVYAEAYRLAWLSVVPFVVLAIVAVACLKSVKEMMTEKVEATVETEKDVGEVKGDGVNV